MFTWKRLILAITGITILILILASAILPGIIIDKAQAWVRSETGRTLAINAVSINPFTLSIEASGVNLSEPGQAEVFVSWDLLRVSISPTSIMRRAPIIRELKLVNPYVHLVRHPENRFNFSDLIPPQQVDEKPAENDGPVYFSVNNVTISKGNVDFYDHSLDATTHHTVRDFNLAIPFIGNLPYLVEHPVQPILQAVINDAPVKLEGNLKPFAEAQELHVKFALDNIDIPHYLGYVPVELPVELKSGRLNFDLELVYRVTAETPPELSLKGQVDLTTLNIFDRVGEQVFFLPLLQCELAPVNLLDNQLHIAALRLYNLEVQVKRDAQGSWNHSRLTMESSAQASEPEPEEAKSDKVPFQLVIDDLWLRDGTVFFNDNLPPGGFSTVANDISFDLRGFTLDNTLAMPLAMSLTTERDEQLAIDGLLTLKPFTISLDTKVRNVGLSPYQPYYHQLANVPLEGTINLDANIAVTPDKTFLLSEGQLDINKLHAPSRDSEGVWIEQVKLADFSFDLDDNRFVTEGVSIDRARLKVSRDPNGVLSFMAGNYPVLSKQAATLQQTDAKPDKEAEGKPFGFLVKTLDLENWQIDFKDSMPAEPAHLQIDNLNLVMQNLAMPEKTDSPLNFSAELPPAGRIKIDGKLVLADYRAELQTSLKNIALKPISPYLAEQTNLVLTNGYLNASLGTRAAMETSLDLQYEGKIGINRMHLLDGTHREDLLKWDSLQVAGIKGRLQPLTMAIDSVTLSDYFAKVLIDEEARVNLVEAFRKDSATPAGEELEPAAKDTPAAETSTDQESSSDIRIGKVVLQGGQVDFTDRNLPRPFHADMRDLGGRIDGLSSDPGARATVDLRGNLRNQSPLNITGQLNPLAKDLFLDIELSFRDIEMTPFSPYSGNYVGYMIEKGKLNLALDYLIENNQLKATNSVFLDQFDFGASVESENAVSLPVKLAVALLKDGNGEIHLDIPVYGSLDDPQFSIASVVWTVIKNLLVKAATSPFALLGALVGGGQEDFSAVSFDYGSSRLSEIEADKLARMAKALLDRPSIDIEISGFIDPEKDPEGYRKEQLAAKVRRLKFLDLVDEDRLPEGAKEEDITVPAEEYADYLWDVYKDEEFPKPRNFIGMTKKLPESEMEKLIYANAEVTDDHLAKLALARALNVQTFLVESGQLPRDRIFLKEPDILEAPKEETTHRARVELGASVR